MPKMSKELDVYVRSMGKTFRVEAWFPDTEDGTVAANEYMRNNPDHAVMASSCGICLICHKYEEVKVKYLGQ
jgi:hypothetical protein